MPRTLIRVFRAPDGTDPLVDWLNDLEEREPRAFAKCIQRILLLSTLGSELRRPHADLLRDGIHELRAKVGRVNYRMLYFFCGSNEACLTHGFTKEGTVPNSEIEFGLKAKRLVERDLAKYTAEWEEE
jgi:hypothetical protein